MPRGFKYKIISRQADRMSDGRPTPGIFDGMAAYRGRGGRTILIRNHENRSRPGEIPVVVPAGKRYDHDPDTRGGNTKLVVDNRRREVVEDFAILGGTHTNRAGGFTPWGTWITCEETFRYGSVEDPDEQPGSGVPHGYAFEMPAAANAPVEPLPIRQAGRFSREAVAWLDGVLYQTEDRGDAALYRFLPDREPRESGDLASFGGMLQALMITGRENFDANTANPRERYPVEWVTIDEPNPDTDTVRMQAQGRGAAIFSRTEGIWPADGRVFFDCTDGGEAELGQVWEYRPRGRDRGTLALIYESRSPQDLQSPDNVVVVPATGDVFLQEDGDDDQLVRGATRDGRIYDFAQTVLFDSEFCGGCFSPNGKTFFLNQKGGRQEDPLNPPNDSAAVTYAIWGPFAQASDSEDDRRGNGGSSRARNRAGKGKGAGCSNGSGLRAE